MQQYKRVRWALIVAALTLGGATATAQAADPVPAALSGFSSTSAGARESAFYAFLSLAAPTPVVSPPAPVPIQIASILAAHPTDTNAIVTALVGLLQAENAIEWTGGAPTAATVADDYGDYYADLVCAVASLNDARTVPALIPAITTGSIVAAALGAQGPVVLDQLVPKIYSANQGDADAAAFVLLWMLRPENAFRVNDSTSMSKIRAMLARASSGTPVAGLKTYIATAIAAKLPPGVKADLNGDGQVNCADLAVIKSSFDKKAGQPGFDIRADVNGDGVVNMLDLSAEARLMPAGTVCQ